MLTQQNHTTNRNDKRNWMIMKNVSVRKQLAIIRYVTYESIPNDSIQDTTKSIKIKWKKKQSKAKKMKFYT